MQSRSTSPAWRSASSLCPVGSSSMNRTKTTRRRKRCARGNKVCRSPCCSQTTPMSCPFTSKRPRRRIRGTTSMPSTASWCPPLGCRGKALMSSESSNLLQRLGETTWDAHVTAHIYTILYISIYYTQPLYLILWAERASSPRILWPPKFGPLGWSGADTSRRPRTQETAALALGCRVCTAGLEATKAVTANFSDSVPSIEGRREACENRVQRVSGGSHWRITQGRGAYKKSDDVWNNMTQHSDDNST